MPSRSTNATDVEHLNRLTLKKGAKHAYDRDPNDPFIQTQFEKKTTDFHWSYTDEPHTSRRKEILKAHPEIRKLFGPEPRTALLVAFMTVSQIWIASWIAYQPWWVICLVTYVYGCTVNHSLQLANHEISHNLVFENLNANMVLGIIANLVTGVPSSVTFRMYHMDHHQYQGADMIDTDIPSEFELRTFTTTFRKAIWLCGQVFAYALRPVFIAPKPINKYQVANVLVCVCFDATVVHFLGWPALAYMLACSLIGLGMHPTAGHFIAEHYEFVKGFETYSYYGSINRVNFNVGYHNEHHDFPKIAWSRLPMVRKIAPEWYEHLPHHDSYLKVLWNYVTDESIGPWSRVKRNRLGAKNKKN